MDYGLLALAAVLLAALVRRQGWLHPAALFTTFWVLIFGVRIVAPMEQAPMTSTAAWCIGVGVLAVGLPALFGRRPGQPDDVQLGDRGVALWRLIVLVATTAVAVGVGVSLFRAYVSDYYVGEAFEELSATAVREAQNAGERGGPLTLLYGFAPLLGALGIYGGLRYSRTWFLVTGLALAATLQSPARIATLGLVATCAAFYVYARPALRQDSDAPSATRPPVTTRGLVVRLAVVAALALAYFVWTGDELGKTGAGSVAAAGWTWPDWMLSPVLYLVGGVAGLAAVTAQPDGYANPFDDTGQSIYLLVRLLGEHPNSLADFTPAPFSINVYTAFGNMFFDFGLAGVIALSLLVGLAAQLAYRAHTVRLEWAWTAAMLVNVLVSTGIAFRLFYLDVAALLVVGWLAFAWLRRSEHWQRKKIPVSTWRTSGS